MARKARFQGRPSRGKAFQDGADKARYLFIGALIGALVVGFLVVMNNALQGDRPPASQPAGFLSGASDGEASRVQDLQSTIKTLEGRLTARPDNASLLVELGNARYDLGVLQLFDLGQEEEGKGVLAQAVTAYQQALDQDPNNVAVRVDMATAAFYCGQNDVARAGFEQALEIEPDYINAHLNYGVFLDHALGDPGAAVEQWEAVLALNPDPETRARAETLINEARK